MLQNILRNVSSHRGKTGFFAARNRLEDADDEYMRSDMIIDDYEGGHGHGHSHGHDHGSHAEKKHGHGHDHKKEGHGENALDDEKMYKDSMWKLKKVLCIGIFFVILQGTGAWFAGSIALAADCAHLATDLLGFGMSMIALYLTRRPASLEYTFGWHRSEVIGTICSIVFLLIITFYLVYEAFRRIFMKYEIDG